MMSALFLISIFHALNQTAAIIRALNSDIYQQSYPTSSYAHYGPGLFENPRVQAHGVHLTTEDLCGSYELSPNTRLRVQNCIVITKSLFSGCLMEEIYKNLFEAGAVAVVDLAPADPPGISCFMKHEWFKNKFEGASMLMVGASLNDDTSSSWIEVAKRGDLELVIEPPYDRRYANIFSSVAWIIVMRIIGPLWALFTSFLALREIREYVRKKTIVRQVRGVSTLSIGFVVFLIEAPSLFLVAIILAMGQYGPYELPLYFHFAFLSLLGGTSLIASCLLALFLREECRPAPLRRNVWVQYKWCIRCGALVSFIKLGMRLLFLDINYSPDTSGVWHMRRT